DLDPDLPQQRLRDGAGRDEDRGVPRGRALERVPDVGEPVLLRAREVGVARPRQGHRLRALAGGLSLGRPRIHPPRPVLVVAVADDERERRPERAPLAQTGEHLDLVRLDLLPRRAAVALLAAPQVGVDRRLVEDEPRGQAGDDRDEGRPVRLAGGCDLEVHSGKPTTRRMTATGAGTPVQSSNDFAPWATSTSRPSRTRAPAAWAASAVAVRG